MIDVKQAVKVAGECAENMLADENLIDARLEEVELSENGQLWYITLSFLREPLKLSDALVGPKTREYKVFTLRSDTGEFVSMKIRNPASV